MSSKTKIVVLHMKEIIYTVIFVIFALLIIGLLIAMFSTPSADTTAQTTYIPGVYSSSVMLNDTPVTIEVAVDDTYITSIRISNMDAQLDALYPLLQPTVEDLSTQICLKQSLQDLTIPANSSHTSMLLIDAIENSLKKAAVQ